jgi:hypothetical protein
MAQDYFSTEFAPKHASRSRKVGMKSADSVFALSGHLPNRALWHILDELPNKLSTWKSGLWKLCCEDSGF